MGDESWDGGPMLTVYFISPWATALMSLAFAPVGIPDATRQRRFGVVPLHSVRWTLYLLPFLKCRFGVVRHFCLGCVAAVLWIPIVYIFARYIEGPVMTAQAFVFFGPGCIAFLPLVIIPFGLLGYALPQNFARVEAKMAVTAQGPFARLLRRALLAPTC